MTAITHLLFTLLGAALVAATLPLVLELFTVTFANLLPARGIAPKFLGISQTSPGHLAVIVPAHNEELHVGRCVASLRASTGTANAASARIVVVAHNCVDTTARRAEEAGAEVLVYNDPAASGKGFALRYGFEFAIRHGAQTVMVVDADSIVSPNTIPLVEAAFESGTRAVQCRYEMESTTQKSSTRLAALAFRGFNVVRPQGRQNLGLSAGILGNGFALHSTVLQAVPYDAFSVVEDLEYHLHLVIAGERVHYLTEARISADFPESKAGESVQRSRWEGGRLLTARKLALPLLGKIAAGHMRLIEPLCDLTGLPLAFGVFALLLAACIPLGWLRWYAAFSLIVVLAHVLTAAAAGPDFLGTLRLLASSPWYILRKLWMIPGVVRGSSAKAAWVRTERDNTL